jgi:hypothetical protein
MAKLPKDLKDVVDSAAEDNTDVNFDIPAGIDIPELQWFERKMLGVRDDIAGQIGAEPEDVQLIGIRVFFKIGEEVDRNSEYIAIATRQKYNLDYQHILEQM